MSVSGSEPSAKSPLSPKFNSQVLRDGIPSSANSSAAFSGAHSKALPSAKLPHDAMNLSIDQLFAKHTVAEIRAVQKRLRADADTKQEELRLMVGERYRDLLQASSSIIAIAKSSKVVLKSIEESRNAIISQRDLPPEPKATTLHGIDDKRLWTLQVLSAHVKILLDAPEHLWRLIERKKYLHAAWLFLLARVVHRALVAHDDGEGRSWVNEGLEVSTDFPLVQRQWDVVSQFRSQIIHKSTLSLRDPSIPSEDTCATLVTLHLLDSRPLNETFLALLQQRTKTIQSILAWDPEVMATGKEGSASATGNGVDSRVVSVREVIQAVKSALNAIARTVQSSRKIFDHKAPQPSLILSVLEWIQIESPSAEIASRLPKELQLSTLSLLTQLTSSANVPFLPLDLRTYRPYTDFETSSLSLTQVEFSQTLSDWFSTSCGQWKASASKWFRSLHSVKDIWTLRTSVRRLVSGFELDGSEKDAILFDLDALSHHQILVSLKQILSDAESEFTLQLRRDKGNEPVTQVSDVVPAEFIFSPPPMPVLSQAIKSFVDTPFQKYQLALKRQLVGRSAKLDQVLNTLVTCAKNIQQDFSLIRGSNEMQSNLAFLDHLAQAYQPLADVFALTIANILDVASTEAINTPENAVEDLIFLSRVTDNLSSSTPFIEKLGNSPTSVQDFRTKISTVNRKLLKSWQEMTVATIVSECRPHFKMAPSQPNGPSPALLQLLLSVSENVRRLGIIFHPVDRQTIVQDIMHSVIKYLLESILDNGDEQGRHDIAFVGQICRVYGDTWPELSALVSKQLKSNASDGAELSKTASECLARTQMLFAVLLPPPTSLALETPLLQFGTPLQGQNYNAPIDLAKPSPRFGMLLVDA